MGASEWAGRMIDRMGDEFGTDPERAVQITNRVRKLISNRDFKELRETGLVDTRYSEVLADELIESLAEQNGETIEARWNNLVREIGLFALVGNDILLYDPAALPYDPDQSLKSETGDTLTPGEAMRIAWNDGIPVEEISNGLRLGTTDYQRPGSPTLGEFGSAHLSQFDRPLDSSRLEIDADLFPLEDTDFPVKASDTDCVIAVAAARRYILEHDGASRDEILEGLIPEENHPLELHGVQARAKGFTASFRDWWWEDVVAPGLRALPDVVPPVSEAGTWRPEGANQGGFDSEATVQKRLEESALLELAFQNKGEERRLIGWHDEISRPSAKPLHGPPVFRFRKVSGDEAIRIRLPDLTELHPISLARLPKPIWDDAIAALTTVVEQHPERIPVADLEVVLEAITNDEVDNSDGIAFLTTVFEAHSELREAIADDFKTVLRNRIDLLTDGDQSEVARGFAILAKADPAWALDTVPQLVAAAESASGATRRWLLYAFSTLAAEYPEELMPATNVLIEGLQADDENVQANASAALGRIADGYPDAAVSITDALVEMLDSDSAIVHANAAGLLADIAQSHPKTVIGHASEIADCLTAEDDTVRIHASIALLRAGGADPGAIRAEQPQIVAALDDTTPAVRANACTLIGNAAVPVADDQLEPLTADPNDHVRERAEWALDQLS